MTATEDAIRAAMGVAKDVAEGRLTPAELDAAAVAGCEALMLQAVGPDDPLWPMQVELARQVLMLGGVPATELAEWAAVQRQAEGEPVGAPVGEPSWIERALEQMADEDVTSADM